MLEELQQLSVEEEVEHREELAQQELEEDLRKLVGPLEGLDLESVEVEHLALVWLVLVEEADWIAQQAEVWIA